MVISTSNTNKQKALILIHLAFTAFRADLFFQLRADGVDIYKIARRF